MTAPTGVLRIDTSGTAFGAAPTWTDRSSYLMSGSTYPIDITWGGQDQHSEPSPRTCTFFLKNDDGFWSPGNAAAPAGWDVGCRANLRVTYNAVTYDRFDGYVESIDPTWPGGKPSWSVVKVSCSDLGTRLGAGQPMGSIYEHQCIEDGATGFWPLDDESTTNFGCSVSGQPAATRVNSKYGSGQIEANSAFGNMPDIVGVTFNSPDANGINGFTSGTAKNSILSIDDPLPASGPFTIEVLSQAPNETIAYREMVLLKWNQLENKNMLLWLYWGSSGPTLYVAAAPGDNLVISGLSTQLDGLEHHLAVTCASDDKTFELFADGVSIGSATLTNVWSTPTEPMQVGGFIGNGADSFYGSHYPLSGRVAGVATYGAVLSDATILEHSRLAHGLSTERTDQRFTRLAGYGGVTVSGLPTGLGTCGPQNTRGFTVTESLQKVARTEGTKAWVEGDGSMTFEARNARYWPTAGLSLTGSDISADSFAVRRDRQGFANEATATRDGGAAQRHVDATSQTAVGRFDAGSLEVATSTDFEALQLAAWKVTTSSAASTRIPDLKVNLLALTSTTTVANCLDATIGTYVALTGLPSNGPATSMNLFVEGATERIGVAEWTIGFFTSPEPTDSTGAVIQTLRADAAASARTALDAGLVIPL